MSVKSKPLGEGDESDYEFVVEMLDGDPTAAINFDRLQRDSTTGQYIIFEYLLCEEWQESRNITPYTSHLNRYMHRNRMKFINFTVRCPAKNRRKVHPIPSLCRVADPFLRMF